MGWQNVPISFFYWWDLFSYGPWKLAHNCHMCALNLISSRIVIQNFSKKFPILSNFILSHLEVINLNRRQKKTLICNHYIPKSLKKKSKIFVIWENDQIGFVTPPDHCEHASKFVLKCANQKHFNVVFENHKVTLFI